MVPMANWLFPPLEGPQLWAPSSTDRDPVKTESPEAPASGALQKICLRLWEAIMSPLAGHLYGSTLIHSIPCYRLMKCAVTKTTSVPLKSPFPSEGKSVTVGWAVGFLDVSLQLAHLTLHPSLSLWRQAFTLPPHG